MEEKPFSSVIKRQAGGRFAPGTGGGPGAPPVTHARELRRRLNEALFKTCSEDRLLAATDAILRSAEAGNVKAYKLLCERIGGPPINSEIAERIEALEEKMKGRHPELAGEMTELKSLVDGAMTHAVSEH